MPVAPGARLRNNSSACEVVVVKAPTQAGELSCAGVIMTTEAREGSATAGAGEVIALGKRYSNDEVGIEVLVVAPGEGPLTFEGAELTQKQATALPASD